MNIIMEGSGIIVVKDVLVDRTRTPQQVLDAIGCKQQYVDKNALATMPKGEGDRVDVWFVSVAEARALFARHRLVPDPYAQAAVNEAFPTFCPNGTQWGDRFLAVGYWGGKRGVCCDRSNDEWGVDYFFSGVPLP